MGRWLRIRKGYQVREREVVLEEGQSVQVVGKKGINLCFVEGRVAACDLDEVAGPDQI